MSNIVTANVVAMELRKLADLLDSHGELEINKPWISFYCDTKEQFVNALKVMPRPLTKQIDNEGKSYDRVNVNHNTDGLDIRASIYKNLTCELVEAARPAVYRCAPILSLEEEESLA